MPTSSKCLCVFRPTLSSSGHDPATLPRPIGLATLSDSISRRRRSPAARPVAKAAQLFLAFASRESGGSRKVDAKSKRADMNHSPKRGVREEDVRQFLKENPIWLSAYVSENVDTEVLEEWLAARKGFSSVSAAGKADGRVDTWDEEDPLHNCPITVAKTKRWNETLGWPQVEGKGVVRDLLEFLGRGWEGDALSLQGFCSSLASAVRASGYNLHFVQQGRLVLSTSSRMEKVDGEEELLLMDSDSEMIREGRTVASYVAFNRKSVCLAGEELRRDPRMPLGVSGIGSDVHVLAYPLFKVGDLHFPRQQSLHSLPPSPRQQSLPPLPPSPRQQSLPPLPPSPRQQSLPPLPPSPRQQSLPPQGVFLSVSRLPSVPDPSFAVGGEFDQEWGSVFRFLACCIREREARREIAAQIPSAIPSFHKDEGELIGVLELWREEGGTTPFSRQDAGLGEVLLAWGSVAIHYAGTGTSLHRQRQLTDFLLDVVRSMFHDMASMDKLIVKIMDFAQKLVSADRASLFLVDHKTKELYSRIFDMTLPDPSSPTQTVSTSPREFRIPLGVGIAGRVAETAESMNIPDAYADPRFHRAIDQETGYTTQSLLAMPICLRGQVIGVMQMVNKKAGPPHFFPPEDEEAFALFAVYCGLALHQAKLYEKLQRSEQKYKVALEVLSYHNSCTEEELHRLFAGSNPLTVVPGLDKSVPCRILWKFRDADPNSVASDPVRLFSYFFTAGGKEDPEKAKMAVGMFFDLFGSSRFDVESVIRFTLTVKRNYRRVPYHNWTHGFHVAHCMYCILRSAPTIFKPLE
ncbi:unnamed protein product, partial [Darwinula stevensoni]